MKKLLSILFVLLVVASITGCKKTEDDVLHLGLNAIIGEAGAGRVAKYCVPMAGGLVYNYAAKAVDDDVLAVLCALAEEAQLAEKYQALLEG